MQENRIVYIQDEQATLSTLNEQFPKLLKRSAPGDQLIFYYCGHGWKQKDGTSCFAPYDIGKSWRVDSIVRQIDKGFHGSRALLLADCCTSSLLSKHHEPGEPMTPLKE